MKVLTKITTDTSVSQDILLSRETKITVDGRAHRDEEYYLPIPSCNVGCYYKCPSRTSISKPDAGLAAGQDELRGQSFWENFSKMQEVAATAAEHMRDL